MLHQFSRMAQYTMYVYVCMIYTHTIYIYIYTHTYIYILDIYISGGPLSALTCCVNARLLSAIKKISPLIYSQSWDGSWVYTTQAMMTFHPDILARMYT